jgi:autotransporter translocation and assembly factor TamB
MSCYNIVMRKLLLIPILFITLLIVIFLLAGTPLVLDFVKGKIESAVQGSTGIDLMIGRMHGNLFYSVLLVDVDIENTIGIDKLTLCYNPFRLLAKKVEIVSVEISGLRVDADRMKELLAELPKKTEDTGTKTSAFVIDIRRFLIASSSLSTAVGNVPLRIALATTGSMTQDEFVLDSLCLITEKSRVMIWGNVPLGEQKDLNLECDMSVALEELGVPDLAGEVQGRGSVGGDFSALALGGSVQLDISYQENKLKGHLDLNWLFPDLRNLSVDAQLSALTAPLQKGADRADSWNIDLEFRNTNLDCDISSNLGEMNVRGVLAGDIKQPYFKGALAGNFDYADFEPSFNGRMQYKHDRLKLSGFGLRSKRVSLDFSLLLNVKTQEILEAGVDLACSDLSVVNAFVRYPPDITGRLRCKLDGSGSLDDLRAHAEVSMSDVMIYGERITNAIFNLSMRDRIAYLDTSYVESERGKIVFVGSFDLKDLDYTGNVYSDGIAFTSPEEFGTSTLLLGGTVGLNLSGSGNVRDPQCMGEIQISNFVYDTLHFGDYQLDFQLEHDSLRLSLVSALGDVMLDGALVLGGIFPFSAYLALRHFVLDDFVTPARGYISADLSGAGALSDLGNTASMMQIDTIRLTLEQRPIENVQAILLNLEGGTLDVQSCELAVAGQKLSVQGTMPLDFPAAVMDFSVNSSEIQLSDIRYLLPGDPAISGIVKLDLHIGGSPGALDIDGQLSLSGGRYDVENVRVDSTGALFRFKNGMLTIERFSGRMNRGRFTVGGYADLSQALLDTMSFTIALDSINYGNKEFGSMVTSADLAITGRRDSMTINGEVVIHEALYDKPLNLQTLVGLLTTVNRPAPQQPELFKRIYCDVGVTVPDSIKIANNVANLAVRADLQLRGYLARLNAYGTIAAIGEGSITYLGKKFQVVNAVVQFDDPYKINPVIDLLATSTIAAADGEYEIYMQLQGTVTNWQLELNSNPPLPEQDIVSLVLIGQRRPGAVGGMAKQVDLKGRVKDYALDIVRNNIERTTADVLGLDEFTIAGDLSEPATLRIGVEKSLAEGFTLYYSTGVESWELQQIGASYDLTRHISVTTLYDQENRNTSVDLELHWKIK